jgi:RNA recognition motif-containing protein
MYGFSRQENQSHVTDLEVFSQNPTRSIFVRDLPYFCCSTDLAKFFFEQMHVPIVHAVVCKNKKRRTLQFGCVMFEKEEHVALAVEEMNGRRFVGRDIRVMLYDTNSPLEASTTGLIHLSFKTLLPQCPLVTEAVLRDSFEQYGDIEHVSIRSHKYLEAGMQGGYGFLTFRTPEQNKQVVDHVRQTVINEVLYDCSWSESNAQKAEIGEAGIDYRYQDSKVVGGRPMQRGAQRPPVALHDTAPYPRLPDPRLNVGPPRGYGGFVPPSYDLPYDRRYPADPRMVDPRLDSSGRVSEYGKRSPHGSMSQGFFPAADTHYRSRPQGMPPAGSRFDESLRPPGQNRFDEMDPYVPLKTRQQHGFDPRISMSSGYDEYDPRLSRLPAGSVVGRGPNTGEYFRSPSEYEDYVRLRAAQASQFRPSVDEYGSLANDRSHHFAQSNRLDPRLDMRHPGYDGEYSRGSSRGAHPNDDYPYRGLSGTSLHGNASGTGLDMHFGSMGPNFHGDLSHPYDKTYARAQMSQGRPGDELFPSNYRLTGASSFPSQSIPPSVYLPQGSLPEDANDFGAVNSIRSSGAPLSSASTVGQLPLDEYGLPNGRPLPANPTSSYAGQFRHLTNSKKVPIDSFEMDHKFDSLGAAGVPGFISAEDRVHGAWFHNRSGSDTSTASKPPLPLFFTDMSGAGKANVVSLEELGGLEDTVSGENVENDKGSLGE